MLQQRIHGADQVPVGGDVDGDHIVPGLRLDMAEGKRPENPGIADENIESAVALVERRAEPSDALGVLRGRPGPGWPYHRRADGVVELLKPSDGARHRHHMRAVARVRAPSRSRSRAKRR